MSGRNDLTTTVPPNRRYTRSNKLLAHCPRSRSGLVSICRSSYWVGRFVLHYGRRRSLEMGGVEIEAFLTDLAVAGHASASTETQAFCVILFLCKYVLRIDNWMPVGLLCGSERGFVRGSFEPNGHQLSRFSDAFPVDLRTLAKSRDRFTACRPSTLGGIPGADDVHMLSRANVHSNRVQ